MAFSELSQPTQANSLVSFLDTASKTINGLMDKPNKGNKRRVNHKKYLQKRLQRQVPSTKPSKPTTMSNSAQQRHAQQPARPAEPAAQGTASVAPFLHHNSWPQLPNYSSGVGKPTSSQPLEPDVDFLIQQLTSTAADVPLPQPALCRPCSDSSIYPMATFSSQQALPASTLETQVILGEQPYGSPYTPSNCSTDDLFDDSCYSSPSSSVYSSPAATACIAASTSAPVSVGNHWSPPTTSMSTCMPVSTASYDWGSVMGLSTQAPTSCMVSCSDWISVSSSPATITASMDQSLPTVPQLWDPLVFSDHVPY